MKRVCRLGIGLAILLCTLTALVPAPSVAQLVLDLSGIDVTNCAATPTINGLTVQTIASGCSVIIGDASGITHGSIKILNNFGTARIEVTEVGTDHKISVSNANIRNAGSVGTADVTGTLIDIKRLGQVPRALNHLGHHYYSGSWNAVDTAGRTSTSTASAALCDDDGFTFLNTADDCVNVGNGTQFSPTLTGSLLALRSVGSFSAKTLNVLFTNLINSPTGEPSFVRGTISVGALKAPTATKPNGDELKVSLTVEMDNSGIPRDPPASPTCNGSADLGNVDSGGNVCVETPDGFQFLDPDVALGVLTDLVAILSQAQCPHKLLKACAALK